MKVLFAVSNDKISEQIAKKYQQDYKEIISSKNVYYFNAIINELQKDKSYDRIVISEDLEMFSTNNYQEIDRFIFEKLDSISDEAVNNSGTDIPIILICTDRRNKMDPLMIKFFGIGIYSALLGSDRSIQKVSDLIYKPRSKKEAKAYYRVESSDIDYKSEKESNGVSESEIRSILMHYRKIGNNPAKCVESFRKIMGQYTEEQVKLIIPFLTTDTKRILEQNSEEYLKLTGRDIKSIKNNTVNNNNSNESTKNYYEKELTRVRKLNNPVIIPTQIGSNHMKNDSVKSSYSQEDRLAEERAKRIAAKKERIARERQKNEEIQMAAAEEARRNEERQLRNQRIRMEYEQKAKTERIRKEKIRKQEEERIKQEAARRIEKEKNRREEARRAEEDRKRRE